VCACVKEWFVCARWTRGTLMCKSVYNNLSSSATHTDTHTASAAAAAAAADNCDASVSHDISLDALHNDSCKTLPRISMRRHRHIEYSTRTHVLLCRQCHIAIAAICSYLWLLQLYHVCKFGRNAIFVNT